MWRAAILAVMATPSVGQQGAADTTLEFCEGACACVDPSQSNAWTDGASGQDMISMRVRVSEWRGGMHVAATWADFITVDNVYQADLVAGAAGSGHAVTVALTHSIQSSSDAAFVVMGHGTANMPTSFSCTAAPNITTSGSTLSSGSVDCDLGAQWAVTNPYPKLSDARVRAAAHRNSILCPAH